MYRIFTRGLLLLLLTSVVCFVSARTSSAAKAPVPALHCIRCWFPMNLCLNIILRCFCVYQGMLCVWFADILPPLVWLAAKTSVLWPIVNTKQVSMVSIFMELRVDQIKTQAGSRAHNKGEIETGKKKKLNSVLNVMEMSRPVQLFTIKLSAYWETVFFKCQLAEFHNKDSQMNISADLQGLFI